jgi:hypothetical protein
MIVLGPLKKHRFPKIKSGSIARARTGILLGYCLDTPEFEMPVGANAVSFL